MNKVFLNAIIFLVIVSLTSCSDKEYPVNNSSYSSTDQQVGCKSKYSKGKKKEIFKTEYKDHWMTWTGKVILPDSGSTSLDVGGGPIQDLKVKFKDSNAGFNLREGQTIRVKFLMKSAGGCFLPFSGKQAQIL